MVPDDEQGRPQLYQRTHKTLLAWLSLGSEHELTPEKSEKRSCRQLSLSLWTVSMPTKSGVQVAREGEGEREAGGRWGGGIRFTPLA